MRNKIYAGFIGLVVPFTHILQPSLKSMLHRLIFWIIVKLLSLRLESFNQRIYLVAHWHGVPRKFAVSISKNLTKNLKSKPFLRP